MANKKIAIAVAILGMLGATAWGRYIFMGTPRYSMAQLQKAIEQQDAAEIEKYLDTEEIAAQIVDIGMASIQQQAIEQNDVYGLLGASMGVTQMFRPQLESQMEGLLTESLYEFPENDLQNLKLASIERNQGDATVTLDLSELSSEEDTSLASIAINLKQQPDRQWQITGLSKQSLKAVGKFLDF